MTPSPGRVVVEVEREQPHGELTLRFFWECHGREIKSRHVLESRTLWDEAHGPWTVGSHVIELAFECPGEPLSYEGELFDVDYVVQAEAKPATALPASAQVDVFVRPVPTSPRSSPWPAKARQ